MLTAERLFATSVNPIDRIRVPSRPDKWPPSRPKAYSGRLFVTALLIMFVRHLHKAVLDSARALNPSTLIPQPAHAILPYVMGMNQ